MDLFISDLDGTLLNSKINVSNQTVEIINDLISRGLNFTIATARSLYSAKKIVASLKLKLPIALFNGVMIYDLKRESYLRENYLSIDIVNYYIEEFEKYGAFPTVFAFDEEGIPHVYYKQASEAFKSILKRRMEAGDKRFCKVNDFSACKNQKIVEITTFNTREIIQPLYKTIKSDKAVNCHCTKSVYDEDTYYLDLLHEKGSKGKAVEFLKEYTGAERVICFGDNLNDLSMFEVADEKYAVNNAVEELKKNATRIIASNDEDGVAIFLKELLYKENDIE